MRLESFILALHFIHFSILLLLVSLWGGTTKPLVQYMDHNFLFCNICWKILPNSSLDLPNSFSLYLYILNGALSTNVHFLSSPLMTVAVGSSPVNPIPGFLGLIWNWMQNLFWHNGTPTQKGMVFNFSSISSVLCFMTGNKICEVWPSKQSLSWLKGNERINKLLGAKWLQTRCWRLASWMSILTVTGGGLSSVPLWLLMWTHCPSSRIVNHKL